MKKRIALITTWFPPQKSVATNRMEAFATYLSEDFEVEVFGLNDRVFSKQWQPTIHVHYASSNKLFERLKSKQEDGKLVHNLRTLCRVLLLKVVKDPMRKWQKLTYKQLQLRHATQPFDIVISSYAPVEPHLIAAQFKITQPSVVWVADMRDEMSKNPGISDSLRTKYREIEELVNERADLITTVSEPILSDFKVLCPKVKHFLEVRNGYNHDFVNKFNSKKTHFQFGYFGSFYGTRKPDLFFEALIEVISKKPDFDCTIAIYGAHNNFHIPEKLSKKIEMHPHLGYQEAIQQMAQMDCNVLIHPRSNQKGVYTGKLFDYISVQRSVLALVDCDDVAAKLVESMGAGYVAECGDLKATTLAIEQIYSDWKKDKLLIAQLEDVQTLHRSHQVRLLKNYLLTL